jgi:chlorite dismutase
MQDHPQTYASATPSLVSFTGQLQGEWTIRSMETLTGASLPIAQALHVASADALAGPVSWRLTAFTSNLRYTTAAEASMLQARQSGLGRSEAVHGALIPIQKNAAWWALAQDERREIYQERSRHTSIGAEYLPQIARRLHHCRDLGGPFDFLTWFEFAPEHEPLFDQMLARMRASEEWRYIDREIDIRVVRNAA